MYSGERYTMSKSVLHEAPHERSLNTCICHMACAFQHSSKWGRKGGHYGAPFHLKSQHIQVDVLFLLRCFKFVIRNQHDDGLVLIISSFESYIANISFSGNWWITNISLLNNILHIMLMMHGFEKYFPFPPSNVTFHILLSLISCFSESWHTMD